MKTAIEIYAIDRGSYASATQADLYAIENQITDGSCASGAWARVNAYAAGVGGCAASGAPAADSYCVGAASGSGSNFFIKRSSTGVISRTCAVQAGVTVPYGGCLAGSGNNGVW